MSLEWTIATRYFFSKRHHPFINVIKKISILGVAVGVAALIVVLAVMNGFENELEERIIGTYAHATIQQDGYFAMTPELEKTIRGAADGIQGFSPFVQGQVLIEKKKLIEGVLLKGAQGDAEKSVSTLAKNIVTGEYPAEGTAGILIGDVLADRLDADVGSTIGLISPVTRKPLPVTVAGIYHSGMYEYDAHMVYVALSLAQEVFETRGGVSGAALKFSKAELAPAQKRRLQQALKFPFYTMTWTDMNRNLFGALKLEKTVMFIILTLIVTVACFNIIGTLTLLVIDKTKDIGILKSLGVPNASIMRIFTWNGFLIGFCGTALGLAMGYGICFLLKKYQFIDLPSDIYYFGKLPVLIDWHDAALIAASSLALSLLSTLYPAVQGASLKPVEALRYE